MEHDNDLFLIEWRKHRLKGIFWAEYEAWLIVYRKL